MARRMPSMTALLALLALAGYQNREKIGEYVKKVSAEGGILDQAKKNLTEKAQKSAEGTSVKSALEEILDQFRHNGEGDRAKSWVETGPNQPVNEPQLKQVLSPDIVDQLAAATGLTREDLLTRLTKVLPEAVDKLTPEGKIPA
jgi:uncharacterized protein YidB (DUF937 family)